MERSEAAPQRRLIGAALAFSLFAFTAPAGAQQQEEEAQQARTVDEVVVTGSRLKRDTFSSIAPLQVINTDVSRAQGAIDPTTILQDTSVSAGQQIDLTFSGFVLDNGPGSTTIDLRGLGAQRSLLLINGRRTAPAGVEGAPFALDLNLIPSALIQSYEVLLDGASSVYGSDALAGVVNVILKKDFDGLELEAFSRIPEYSNGVENTLRAAWGVNTDRGFLGIAADFASGEQVQRRDRPWSSGCQTYIEETTDGEIRTENIAYQWEYGMKSTPCTTSFGSQRAFEFAGIGFGSIYYTDGETNTGIPNLSEANIGPIPLDTNDDGVPDVDFTDYFITNENNADDLLPERERVAAMAYGEYTFAGEMNITPYFELIYSKAETQQRSTGGIIQQGLPANNPFNPCNPNGTRGVDCGQAYNAVIDDPEFVESWRDFYEGLCAQFGFSRAQCVPALFGIRLPGDGTIGAAPLEAQFSVRGDRSNYDVELEHTRFVAGVRGDLPMLSFGSLDNWSWDAAYVMSDSVGTADRPGVRQDRLEVALGTYSLNNTPCVIDDPNAVGESGIATADLLPDASAGCVPVDLFAPSLYQSVLDNEFATQAERDFLFDNRSFDTDYMQQYIMLTLTGDLFDVPAGPVAAAIGYEYRHDEIDSQPNIVAEDGLLWGFFRDAGAVGEKDTEEWFAEIEIPILANKPAFRELNVNFAARHTDDEFYGGAWTYSAKLGWRPVDSLLVRGTVGTSYRAPNLRENFLIGQSGFLTLSDICVPSDQALSFVPGVGVVYDRDQDTRSDATLDNCRAAGVDPETLGIISSNSTRSAYSVEILRASGNVDLEEEGAETWTAGISWEQPFFNSFDLTLGVTYYETEITQEIIAFGAQRSINECYLDPQGLFNNPACDQIQRQDLGGGTFGFIDEVNQQFLNRDLQRARGLDININLDVPVQMFGRAFDLGFDGTFNRKYELSQLFLSDNTGLISTDTDLGEPGFPEWEGQGIFRADFDDYRLQWSVRYLSSVETDIDTRNAFPFTNVTTGGSAWTCLGPDLGDVDCRPVGTIDNYFRHDMSFYYYGDVWTVGVGARNVFDEAPPRVDGRTVFSAYNVPFGSGYDINGRQFFINLQANFDGLSF